MLTSALEGKTLSDPRVRFDELASVDGEPRRRSEEVRA
jgi:hypothetical protein